MILYLETRIILSETYSIENQPPFESIPVHLSFLIQRMESILTQHVLVHVINARKSRYRTAQVDDKSDLA